MSIDVIPSEVPATSITSAGLPGVLSTKRGYVAVPTQDVRSFVLQQSALIGVGFAIGVGVGIALGWSRRGSGALSGLGTTGVTKRINLFQQAIDRGNCRAAEGLIDRMGEERAVQMLRSMIQQYRGTCQG